jgi:hypothetical protein
MNNEEFQSIKIEKAQIGEYAKEVNSNLLLEYSKEKLRLVLAKEGTNEISLPNPWLFKEITGIDLKYSPLGLNRIVLEVVTKRQRDSTKKQTTDSFMILFFKTSEIIKIEELIKEHKFEALAKDGIADFLLKPPFTYSYSVSLRKGMNFLAKASRIFITLCFAYSILKWFFYCTPDPHKPGEECTTYLSTLHQFLSQIFYFVFASIVSPVISLIDDILSPLPWLKYFLALVISIIFLPLWLFLTIWGLIIYFADFVIRFHILFYVWDAFSIAVSNFKYLSSISKTIVTFTSYIWNTIRTCFAKNKEKQL